MVRSAAYWRRCPRGEERIAAAERVQERPVPEGLDGVVALSSAPARRVQRVTARVQILGRELVARSRLLGEQLALELRGMRATAMLSHAERS